MGRNETRCASFNPHRPRRAGEPVPRESFGDARGVSIRTGPEGPVNHGRPGLMRQAKEVSIRTGPEGPVNPARRQDGHAPDLVSIRTGPEGPVNLSHSRRSATRAAFQSAPAPKGR